MSKQELVVLLIVAAVLGAPLTPAEESGSAVEDRTSFEQLVRPFLKRHCFECHGPDEQRSRIRFDQVAGYRTDDEHLWTLVHERLSEGTMPPKKRTRPEASDVATVLSWIEKRQRATRGGAIRRLNRRELAAALRDVTGLEVDYAAALPGDGKVAGFDTGAEGLQDSADSVDRILEVTRRAVDGIRILQPRRGGTLTADLREARNRKGGFDARAVFDPWKAEGAYVKVRGFGRVGEGFFIDPKWLGERGGFTLYVPPPEDGRGVLRLKLLVARAESTFEGVPNPHLWVTIAGTTVETREITRTKEQPHHLVYEMQLDDLPVESRGISVVLSHRVEIPYRVEGFENEDRSRPKDNVPGGTGLFRPAYDRKKKVSPEEKPVPWLILQRIEIETDYLAAWPPAAWNADVGEIEDDDASAARLISLWTERAWRRPTREDERERFNALYRRLREGGLSFDDSLRATFQSVLLSGPFRYLPSVDDADGTRAQHAIASRLSFLLVGAPPDAELRELAVAGRLRDPGVLGRQVDRLLGDPRSDGFLRPFVTQWLEIGQPITIAMRHLKKQDFRFGRYLKASMREETIAYVARLVRGNRPARELIVSDWTMMNDILAIHYGYEGIEGEALRPVTLRSDDPRGGGVLGHAGIQSMLCWMGENWVIYRGAWTLRHILDDPPPPPPLEVPELIPSDGENQGKTFKELLLQHQNDEKCSVCHESIDPLGFAFQNFDLSGRWRDVEHERYVRNELDGKIEWWGAGEARPVDTDGRLPRGEEFSSFAECKALIVEHYLEDLVRGLMKNLLLYATGRTPDVADLAEIRSVMESLRSDGYPLKDLLKGVVRTRAFRGGQPGVGRTGRPSTF